MASHESQPNRVPRPGGHGGIARLLARLEIPASHGTSATARTTMASEELLTHAIERPPASSVSYEFKIGQGSVRAQLVLDSDAYTQALGGLQIRSSEDAWVANPSKLQTFTESAARYASWKAWLAQVPVSGGKLVVTLPDELYRSQNPASAAERQKIIRQLATKISSSGYDFCARRDTGLTNDLLQAFQEGGGKVAAFSLQPDASRYTAESVVEGFAWALKMRFSFSNLDGARVMVDYSGGKVGMELARLFRGRGAELSVVDRDQSSRDIASEVAAELVPSGAAYDRPVDIFCYAGQPRQFGDQDIIRFKAKVVGGPADDLLSDPSLYGARDPEECLVLPGAVLTAGSLGLPDSIPDSVEQVRMASRGIVGNVLMELEAPLCSPFQAMVIAAKRAKARMDTFNSVTVAAHANPGSSPHQ